MMEKFKKIYQISDHATSVPEDILMEYQSKIPKLLIDLWKSDGFGKYNQGILEMVNPKDFEPVLWTWLGQELANYVPFAITGFGELFYYRKLTDTDEDVCMLNIQYRKVEVIVWDLESFFEDFLTSAEERTHCLREDLFYEAINAQGGLARHEIFTFVPILAVGGAPELQYLKKGNAQVYQDIVFQMTN